MRGQAARLPLPLLLVVVGGVDEKRRGSFRDKPAPREGREQRVSGLASTVPVFAEVAAAVERAERESLTAAPSVVLIERPLRRDLAAATAAWLRGNFRDPVFCGEGEPFLSGRASDGQ